MGERYGQSERGTDSRRQAWTLGERHGQCEREARTV